VDLFGQSVEEEQVKGVAVLGPFDASFGIVESCEGIPNLLHLRQHL
jgi:hypothetical protein